MRRVLSAEALPFVDQARLSRIERTKDGRDSRFAASVFGIDERKLRQRNLSTRIHQSNWPMFRRSDMRSSVMVGAFPNGLFWNFVKCAAHEVLTQALCSTRLTSSEPL